MIKVNRLNNNSLFNRFYCYFENNSFFVLLLVVSFVSMCLSIVYRPFAYLTFAALIMGSCVLDYTEIIIITILYCFTFNGLVEIQILPTSDIGTTSLFFGLVTIVVAMKYLMTISKIKKRINYSLLLILSVFLIYVILPIYEFKINILWTFAFFINFYCLFEMRQKLKLQEILNYATIGLFVASLLSVAVRSNLDLSEALGLYYDYGMLKFQAIFYNPNFLGIYCLILISFLMLLQVRDWKSWRLTLMIVVYGLGISTISRSFIICSSIAWLLFFLILMTRFKKDGLRKVLVSGLCIMFCFVILYPYSKVYILRFEQMISNSKITVSAETLKEDNNDLKLSETSDDNNILDKDEKQFDKYDNPSREVLFELYWEDYVSSPKVILFGRGVCASHQVGMAPHNSYIGLLWNVGLLGTMLFIGIIIYALIKIKAKMDSLILIIPFLIMCFVETMFFTMWFWLVSILFIMGGGKNDISQCDYTNLQGGKFFK